MRLRLARHVQVDVNIPTGLCRGYKIAPLLFITLIENAFKHGTSASTRSFVKINMSEPSPGVIECDIENSSFPKNETDKSGSGIGLKIYPDNSSSYTRENIICMPRVIRTSTAPC